MTEEIIHAIKQAEEQASLEKQAAISAAEKLLEEAQKECAQLEQTTLSVCKAYKESGKKAADEQAQKEYEESIIRQTQEAKTYCEGVMRNADALASKIVGRITRGDC